jgi:hypothetical protein
MLGCYVLSKLEGDEMFTDKTLFSDEATFHLSGNSNVHNFWIYGINNPHLWMYPKKRQPQVKLVLCPVQINNVQGFLSNKCKLTVAVELYTHDGWISYTDYISEDKVANAMLLLQLGELSNCIWGRKILDMELSWKSIGRSRIVTCSRHSSDIISFDFFFWRYIKNYVIFPLILLEISGKIASAAAVFIMFSNT